MNTNKRKKRALFKKFALNYQHCLTILNNKEKEINEKECYVCPLSLKKYQIEHLNEQSGEFLTAEHAPPLSYKGKVVALTAKSLNNQSGHTLDLIIGKYLAVKGFNEGKTMLPLKFRINNEFSIFGGFSKKENKLQINFTTKGFHQGTRKFLQLIESKESIAVKFTYSRM